MSFWAMVCIALMVAVMASNAVLHMAISRSYIKNHHQDSDFLMNKWFGRLVGLPAAFFLVAALSGDGFEFARPVTFSHATAFVLIAVLVSGFLTYATFSHGARTKREERTYNQLRQQMTHPTSALTGVQRNVTTDIKHNIKYQNQRGSHTVDKTANSEVQTIALYQGKVAGMMGMAASLPLFLMAIYFAFIQAQANLLLAAGTLLLAVAIALGSLRILTLKQPVYMIDELGFSRVNPIKLAQLERVNWHDVVDVSLVQKHKESKFVVFALRVEYKTGKKQEFTIFGLKRMLGNRLIGIGASESYELFKKSFDAAVEFNQYKK